MSADIRERSQRSHEGDILVTEDGYEVLTKVAPKEALRYLKEPTM